MVHKQRQRYNLDSEKNIEESTKHRESSKKREEKETGIKDWPDCDGLDEEQRTSLTRWEGKAPDQVGRLEESSLRGFQNLATNEHDLCLCLPRNRIEEIQNRIVQTKGQVKEKSKAIE